MEHLVQENLFGASGQFAAEGRFCAFRFWFNRVNKEWRKML